jgi:hypothetical protein
MIKFFQNIIKNFKENKNLKKENETLKEALLKLDPAFKVIPFLKVSNIQKWKTANNETLPINMGYFDYSIDILQSIVKTQINKEALYILLRKITSEQMNEIEARNFIYALFIVLNEADNIPTLEVHFQKVIANKNMGAMIKYNILR